MDRFVLRLVSLLPLLWSAQYCWGAIVALIDVTCRRRRSVVASLRRLGAGENEGETPSTLCACVHLCACVRVCAKVRKRDTSGQPHIDGTHQFHDGYRRGSIYYAGGSSQVWRDVCRRMRVGVGPWLASVVQGIHCMSVC